MSEFRWEKRDLILSKCLNCNYYFGDGKCEAFPDGIPDKILDNSVEHNKVMEEQIGDYIFEPIKK